jgi:hypothetical protein
MYMGWPGGMPGHAVVAMEMIDNDDFLPIYDSLIDLLVILFINPFCCIY